MVPWSSNPKRSLTVLAIKTMVALIFSRNNFFSADAEQEERKGGPRFPENSAGGKIIEELFFLSSFVRNASGNYERGFFLKPKLHQ
jgi:hypothetical protein